MVIAGLESERQRDIGQSAGLFQEVRFELSVQELIHVSLIDQKVSDASAILDQRDGIVAAPRRQIVSQIA